MTEDFLQEVRKLFTEETSTSRKYLHDGFHHTANDIEKPTYIHFQQKFKQFKSKRESCLKFWVFSIKRLEYYMSYGHGKFQF